MNLLNLPPWKQEELLLLEEPEVGRNGVTGDAKILQLADALKAQQVEAVRMMSAIPAESLVAGF